MDQLRSQNHELQHELQKALQRHQQATEASNAAHRLAVGELRQEAGELGAAVELARLNVQNGLSIAEGLAGALIWVNGHEAGCWFLQLGSRFWAGQEGVAMSKGATTGLHSRDSIPFEGQVWLQCRQAGWACDERSGTTGV